MSSIKLAPAQEPTGGVKHITPLLLPRLNQHYQVRASRLVQLAEGHAMGDYLKFTAGIAAAQQRLLDTFPLPDSANARLELIDGQAPLDHTRLHRDPYWQQVLGRLIEELRPNASPEAQAVLDELRDSSSQQLEQLADSLLAGDFAQVGSGRALFLWSALSLYWAQLAARLPLEASAELGEQRQFCPVCAGSPSASVVLGGDQSGLRYLHCGLCESRWHMVRVKCSNCEEGDKLDYWSLETKDAPLKAESCSHCMSYLKLLYLDRANYQEVFADDLASLALDAEIEREGFARSGLNPLLFPG
ncbi:formate dehydrogenase accessory protein FdhE [Pseudomonas sp. ANT_H14]|uniref:formate dehydrogenase accessory protein FdhE n=1 Tax=unclassified Pseudomonas TaxID=196821 RepID=UPI0011EEF9E0|nr:MULTISPECIES: formate dehydrogenase accessory protein FdhE [unclassified Pseudomonas]KAA0941262.1 formate dehydrogenase accessory protein FdhE [Pseudomonas sp. ANT_H4]KAA0945894.1 formate dehydrogenase accessory protein FdhE [Pseudomonas sp. ANT_H14]